MPPDEATVSRILDRVEHLIDRVSTLAERLAGIESDVRSHSERQQLFWTKDWPEIVARISRAEGRLDNYSERLGKAEAAATTALTDAAEVCKRVEALEQAPGGPRQARVGVVGGAAGGVALVLELFRQLGVF